MHKLSIASMIDLILGGGGLELEFEPAVQYVDEAYAEDVRETFCARYDGDGVDHYSCDRQHQHTINTSALKITINNTYSQNIVGEVEFKCGIIHTYYIKVKEK